MTTTATQIKWADGDTAAAAMRVWCELVERHAIMPSQAITDRQLAKFTGLAERDIIDLVRLLAEQDYPVIATCSGGRYIEKDPAVVRAYGERLHDRAKKIHVRARIFLDLADRMDAAGPEIDSTGQRRLFA